MPDEKKFPMLYKAAVSGKVQEWEVWALKSKDAKSKKECGVIMTRFGQRGGKKREEKEVIAEGKNLGKKNATTAYEQACLEAASAWAEKRDRKGYTETDDFEAMKSARSVMPMLAKVYEDHAKKVDWDNAFMQPKLDGFRCLCRIEDGRLVLRSRENKLITTMGHIVDQLRGAVKDDWTLDGELYLSGVTFSDISSYIKRVDVTPEQAAQAARVEYHVYDVAVPTPFQERYQLLLSIVPPSLSHVKPVLTVGVRTAEELMDFQRRRVEEGFEGAILRHGTKGYDAGKRSDQLLKVKTFKDAEFQVIQVNEGKGSHAGMAVFKCRTKAGHLFDVTAHGSHDEKKRYWEDREKYIGKMLTVKYQDMTTTAKPVPRFPIAMRFKEKL